MILKPRGPPKPPDRLDFRLETKISGIAPAFAGEFQNGQQIVGYRRINVPEVGRVPAPVFLGVVPGKQEVRHAPGLAGVALGDRAKASEGFERSGFHTEHEFKSSAFRRGLSSGPQSTRCGKVLSLCKFNPSKFQTCNALIAR